jgi:hypothetical protein
MNKLLFRGAYVRYFDVRAGEDGVFSRIHFTADFSSPVRDEMEWEDVPECVPSCKLTGKLDGRHAVLTPTQQTLLQHELQLAVSDIGDFQLHRIQGKDGESTKTELRFVARSAQEGAAGLVENWMRRVGQEAAALSIHFERAEQRNLFDAAAAPNPQMTLAAEPEDGPSPEDEPEPSTGPALASVVEMAGSTAELRKRSRQKAKAAEPEPEAEAEPEGNGDWLRSLSWGRNGCQASIEIYEEEHGQIGALINGMIGTSMLQEAVEPRETVPHAIVSAAGILERWGRSVFESAKSGRDKDSQRAASEVVSQALEWAGQARVEGRTA